MEKPLLNDTGTGTCSVDVLFVTNQAKIAAPINRLLLDKKFTWLKTGIDDFIDSVKGLGIIGTVIVDTTEIKESQIDKFQAAIKKLERANTASILLNDHIDFPFEKFNLVTLLRSASLDEIWGRIETNVMYRRRLSPEKKNDPAFFGSELADDTADQLKMAGQVQRNFLPVQLPNTKVIQWATVFQPADWVSGDIYDIARLDEQHVGFYIADAVGHSVPAGLLTMFLKHAITMRETKGSEYRIFEPVEVIRNLNVEMAQQQLSGCLFATCCYCLLNVRSLQMTYARGGHPYPILIHKGCEPQQLENRGGLLGVFPEAEFEQKTIQLESGDKLLLYSDGGESVVGQCNEKSEFVFTDTFCSLAAMPIEQMTAEFASLAKNREVTPAEVDDVTAVGLEIL
ncbi:MAG: PP2C family protein-serine/threonine phosphatase [Planctomycetota bacterium]|jgi:sigma-B regulation protein RsbU (phosphoserine phosphatase)